MENNRTGMHQSAFNQFAYDEAAGRWLLYNFMTDCLTALGTEEKEKLETDLFFQFPKERIQRLAELGILADRDEVAVLRERTKKAAMQMHSPFLTLTICPTMDCNFSCPYCIETSQKSKGVMTEDTERLVAEFVRQLLKDCGAKFLNIVWYGGEPLLSIPNIERLSRSFLRICHDQQCFYTAGVITNGYLLTTAAALRLSRCCVRYYRITLDGAAEVHDKSRMLKGGAPTFDTIMKNLRSLWTDSTIEIRCNVSRANLASVDELEKEIAALRQETGNRIVLHYARTMVCREVPEELRSAALTEEEFSAFAAQRDDMKALTPDAENGLPCAACKTSSFVIDPQGNLFKCNAFLGQKEHILANVSELPTLERLMKKADSVFFQKNAFPENEKCLSCKMLPVCLGSCPLDDETTTPKRCQRYRLCPEEYVRKLAQLRSPEPI